MAMVTSARNPLLQDVRKAIRRGTLTDGGFCVAEGRHLLEEAVRSNCDIEAVLAAETARPFDADGLRVITLADSLFLCIAATETSQGVITLVRPPSWSLKGMMGPHALVLVLDGIQDPGNAGTMLRAAEAFGATGVVFLKGSVNPYHPKTIRASAGSLFRTQVVSAVEEQEFLDAARLNGLTLYAALPTSAHSPATCDFTKPGALIVGSEGQGVRAALQAIATPVTIPTSGVESLNAGVAAAILLYEAQRQRMEKT